MTGDATVPGDGTTAKDGTTTAEGAATSDGPRAGERSAGGIGREAVRDLCDTHVVHEEEVEAARRERADPDRLTYLADTFQMLANPTRLQIVDALDRRELCVCDLAAVVEASPSAVSHHLRQLRQMRIVRYRKEGRMAYYRLDDDHIASLFAVGLEHVEEREP